MIRQFYTFLFLILSVLCFSCEKNIIDSSDDKEEKTEKPSNHHNNDGNNTGNDGSEGESSDTTSESSGTIDVTFENISKNCIGSQAHPISVAEFLNKDFSSKYVWVKGYIVGSAYKSISNANFIPPFEKGSSILLADAKNERSIHNVISIQLSSASMKNNVGLVKCPKNLGRILIVCGRQQNYLGIKGMKGADITYLFEDTGSQR